MAAKPKKFNESIKKKTNGLKVKWIVKRLLLLGVSAIVGILVIWLITPILQETGLNGLIPLLWIILIVLLVVELIYIILR